MLATDGIQLMSFSVTGSDIVSFEIWDAETESCIAALFTESDFIDCLFSMQSGDYQLRPITEVYQLIGYITL